MSDKTQSVKKAVGLSYFGDKGLPKVILKGSGEHANQIAKIAKKDAEVPVFQDSELVSKLYRLPMESEISRDMFEVVALLLAHVLKIEQSKGRTND